MQSSFFGSANRMVLAFLLVLASRANSQDVMQPKHVAQLQGVTSAVMSPDGSLIAAIMSVPRQPFTDDDGPAWSHLMVVDRVGNSRPFITGHVSIGTPQWSPDGKAIFYSAKRGEDQHASLYRIPVDGGESVRVVEHETSVGGFALSADGQRVAFLATEKKNEEAKALEEKGFDQEIFEEDWDVTKVWLADLNRDDTSDEAKPRALELPGSASQVVWSPNGSQLAVVLAPTPSVDDSYMAKHVHVVDIASGKVVRTIEHTSKLGDVQWSPDGSTLAMIAGVDINDPSDGRLMIVGVSDTAPRDLMSTYEAHVESFAWRSPQELVWTAGEGTLTRVGTVTLDGTVNTLVEPSPEQLLSKLTLSQDGQVAAFVGHARTHYNEVFSMELGSEKPSRLTNSNPWLDNIQFARQETITWNATDGLELQGVLLYPLEYEAGARYPMIMLVHGGPEAHESDGWLTSYSRPGQVAAARGFFVFYPNYRGSTGRGVKFSMMGQGDAAGKEFSDLIDGIDHLVTLGLIDKDKVGITGGSYGGYASAWGATYYSHRFAASVMFVGISDNVSKVGTTDIPEEMYQVHHRKRLWEDWDYFLERSPIRHVEKNRTPTLIMHGKQDPRVHPSQSLELHRHLKTLGQAPVRLVLYEGEGHGNRKSAARLDYNLRLLRWMEHYLKGPGGLSPPMSIDYKSSLGIEKEKPSEDSGEATANE